MQPSLPTVTDFLSHEFQSFGFLTSVFDNLKTKLFENSWNQKPLTE